MSAIALLLQQRRLLVMLEVLWVSELLLVRLKLLSRCSARAWISKTAFMLTCWRHRSDHLFLGIPTVLTNYLTTNLVKAANGRITAFRYHAAALHNTTLEIGHRYWIIIWLFQWILLLGGAGSHLHALSSSRCSFLHIRPCTVLSLLLIAVRYSLMIPLFQGVLVLCNIVTRTTTPFFNICTLVNHCICILSVSQTGEIVHVLVIIDVNLSFTWLLCHLLYTIRANRGSDGLVILLLQLLLIIFGRQVCR